MYTLFWIGIIAGLDSTTIRSAMAFYVIGATVGLFNRLYSDTSAVTQGGDYKLSATRLLGVPLLSGTAAIIGVVIVTMGAAIQNDAPPTSLKESLSLIDRPLNILAAAVFGFTPGIVVDRLRQETDKVKDDLKSVKPQAAGKS